MCLNRLREFAKAKRCYAQDKATLKSIEFALARRAKGVGVEQKVVPVEDQITEAQVKQLRSRCERYERAKVKRRAAVQAIQQKVGALMARGRLLFASPV